MKYKLLIVEDGKEKTSLYINNNIDNLIEIIKNLNPDIIVCKKANINEVVRIKRLVTYKEFNKLKYCITKELLYLGYDISHKGTQYLIKIIEYIIKNPQIEFEKLEKIYSKVATLYNTSSNNIKCRINKASTEMYYNCEIKKLKEYFNFDIDVKPRVRTIIDTVISKVYNKCNFL